jgi:hypothetical protein
MANHATITLPINRLREALMEVLANHNICDVCGLQRDDTDHTSLPHVFVNSDPLETFLATLIDKE